MADPLTTKAKVLLAAPELADESDARFEWAISAVAMEMNATSFGQRSELAATYLVAHTLTVTRRRGSAAVVSMAAGGVSKAFANSGGKNPREAELASTAYGARFLSLSKGLNFRAAVT